MYNNVFKSDVCYENVKPDSRSVALPGGSVSGNCKRKRDSVTVTTRVFYNSKCQTENVKALFSRGNKRRILRQGTLIKSHTPFTHKTSGAINGKGRNHGMTVLSQPPLVTVVDASVQKAVQQITSSKSPGEPVYPQKHHLVSQVKQDSQLGGLSAGGPIKQVAPAIEKCDNGITHEPSAINNSVEGVNVNTQENQESNNTYGSDDGQTLAPLFDINECIEGDKYLNMIVNKKLNKALSKNQYMACNIFRQWRAQSEFDFGFIPLSDFILPSDESVSEYVSCPIECHRKVKASGNLNFLKCRIPVRSQLNIEEWEKQLQDYWDIQLLQLLKFGFPLDFNRASKLKHDNKNHTSATEFSADVETYLSEEIKYGAILGPYSQCPIADCHFSPFMTREKSTSNNRRVIIDLSWPKHFSVNAGVDKNSYLGTDFILSFPTIDDITDAVKKVGRGAHIYKIDVSRAFRHVRLDPHDYDLMGLNWKGVTYVDATLAFGSRHGTQIFQRLSDAIRHMMRRQGFTVLNYVDDFLGIATPSVARRSYDALLELLQKLGLEVSVKKLVGPATKVTCLGVDVDSVERMVSIPDAKLRQIVVTVKEWLQKHFCSKRQLQSLLGNLLYVHKCVKPGRYFLNRMLELLRNNYDASTITLTNEFKRDLRWFDKFLSRYNGRSFFDHKPVFGVIDLDACLTGLGGRYNNKVYHLPVVKHFQNLGIVHLEMVNILVAVRIFALDWQHRSILVRCDNAAVVQVLNNGKTKDPFLATCARNIWYCMAHHDINLSFSHVLGKNNQVADLLSRWQNTQQQMAQLWAWVENPLWMHTDPFLLELDYEI